MDILALACALVATILYYGTLYGGFVYDDRRAILTNPDLRPSTPWQKLLENDFWGTPLRGSGSHGSYRPLCVATFRLNYIIGGLEPLGYHVVNVVLHAICSALVVRVARKILPGQTMAQAIAGLLFAVHPIHSEAVASIVGRADLLACLFTQLAFLAYMEHCSQTKSILPLIFTLLFSVMANLAKETGISSLALCLVWEFCRNDSNTLNKETEEGPSKWRSSTILAGSFAILTLGRFRIGGGRVPEFASADNPVARHPSRLVRGLTFLYLPAASVRMLLCPSTLSFDWSMDAVPRITSLKDPRNVETICLYIVLVTTLLWALRQIRRSCRRMRSRSRSSYDLSSYVLQSSSMRCPVCAGRKTGYCHTDGCRAANNNNGPVECYCLKNKRPSENASTKSACSLAVSVLVIISFLVLPFLPASNVFFYVGFVIAERILYLPSVGACLAIGAGISGSYHIARKMCYDRIARTILFATIFLLSVMSARTLLRNEDWRNEESLYRSALRINPPKAYGNLGSVLSAQGRTDEAEVAFVQALRYRPNMADVHYNLGILQQGKRKYEDAILCYQRAIHFRPSFAQAYVNLGAALSTVGRGTEAVAVLRIGASLDGSSLKDREAHEVAKVQALLQLGTLYAEQRKFQRALTSYREALRTLPEHFPPQVFKPLL